MNLILNKVRQYIKSGAKNNLAGIKSIKISSYCHFHPFCVCFEVLPKFLDYKRSHDVRSPQALTYICIYIIYICIYIKMYAYILCLSKLLKLNFSNLLPHRIVEVKLDKVFKAYINIVKWQVDDNSVVIKTNHQVLCFNSFNIYQLPTTFGKSICYHDYFTYNSINFTEVLEDKI